MQIRFKIYTFIDFWKYYFITLYHSFIENGLKIEKKNVKGNVWMNKFQAFTLSDRVGARGFHPLIY